MKLSFKKAAIIIAVSVMSFSVCSCNSDNDSNNSSSETNTAETTISSTASEETTDAADTDSDVSGSSDSSTYTDEDSLKYDFTGLKSEKYIKILQSDRYMMIGKQEDVTYEFYQDCNQKKSLDKMCSPKIEYGTFLGNGQIYNYAGDKYFIQGKDTGEYASQNIYQGAGYIESGEKDIDGTKYFYDDYYSTAGNGKFSIFTDKDGKIYSLVVPGGELIIKDLSDEFDDSVFNILEKCKEASQKEVMDIYNSSNEETKPAE